MLFFEGKIYKARAPLSMKSMQLIIQTLFQDEMFDSYVKWTKALHQEAKSRGLQKTVLEIGKQIKFAKEIHDRAYHLISWQNEPKDFR